MGPPTAKNFLSWCNSNNGTGLSESSLEPSGADVLLVTLPDNTGVKKGRNDFAPAPTNAGLGTQLALVFPPISYNSSSSVPLLVPNSS